MKQTIRVLVLVMILPCKSMAQDSASTSGYKGYVSIGYELSLPTGLFGANGYYTGNGMATVGSIFDISCAYKIYKDVGFAATIRWQHNSMDEEALRESWDQYGSNPSVSSVSGWSTNYFLGGAYLGVPVSPNVSFHAKLLGGLSIGESPSYKINYWYNGNQIHEEGSGKGEGFAILAGCALLFDLGSRLCLLIQSDYTSTAISYEGVEVTTTIGSGKTYTKEITVNSFNVGVGLGFRL